MTEQELRDIIQQAWCDGNNNLKDKFGDFLTRAANRIKEAGYVRLDKDQTTLPEGDMDNYTAIQMFKAGWRKVIWTE